LVPCGQRLAAKFDHPTCLSLRSPWWIFRAAASRSCPKRFDGCGCLGTDSCPALVPLPSGGRINAMERFRHMRAQAQLGRSMGEARGWGGRWWGGCWTREDYVGGATCGKQPGPSEHGCWRLLWRLGRRWYTYVPVRSPVSCSTCAHASMPCAMSHVCRLGVHVRMRMIAILSMKRPIVIACHVLCAAVITLPTKADCLIYYVYTVIPI